MSEENQINDKSEEAVATTPVVNVVPPTSNPVVASAPVVTKPANNHNVLIAIIGTLVIMAGIQVWQTQQLMAAVSSGSLKAGTAAPAGSPVALPSQVGGCG